MLAVKNLYHDYDGKGSFAVQDVNFCIERGEIFGFLGPSGAGKSTVQNILTGLLPLQRGDVTYEDVSIRRQGADFFNRLGVSFEHPNLYSKLTGYENLKFFAGLFNEPTEDPALLLDMVQLTEAAHRKVNTYSKGMRQRLVFARALVNKPRMLFLDEPTSGLDPNTANVIKAIILQKKAEGCTIFLTTHNMTIADELCDRVAFLNNGQIVAMDTPRNLKLRYGERSVQVEYQNSAGYEKRLFFLDRADDHRDFLRVMNGEHVQTVHSQEATLEQIFVQLTGRGLS